MPASMSGINQNGPLSQQHQQPYASSQSNAQQTGTMNSSKNQVLIHVCDEAKKRTQDFRCDKTLLLKSMKYFEKYLSD